MRQSSPVRGWHGAAKRGTDIALALIGLIVALPLFIIVPLLIKLEDPGPVFFRQKRYGHNSVLFDCLKFRSMYLKSCSGRDIRLTERDDPRVTHIGQFIRRTSIDELPQLINVLKGDMSIVGPRPHPPGVRAGGKIYEDVIERFERRYAVKPGLTGLAQVRGYRGNTFTEDDLRRRFEADMEYIRTWSLRLDFAIILRTLLALTGKNAF